MHDCSESVRISTSMSPNGLSEASGCTEVWRPQEQAVTMSGDTTKTHH